MPPMEWHVLSSGGGTEALEPSPWASSVAMEDLGVWGDNANRADFGSAQNLTRQNLSKFGGQNFGQSRNLLELRCVRAHKSCTKER